MIVEKNGELFKDRSHVDL